METPNPKIPDREKYVEIIKEIAILKDELASSRESVAASLEAIKELTKAVTDIIKKMDEHEAAQALRARTGRF